MASQHPKTTYSIRIVPHHAPDVSRVLELRGDHKLSDLHAAIAAEFELGTPPAYRFFRSNRAWDRATEYAGDGKAKRATLGGLELAPGAAFLYVALDAIEHWHRCEVTAVADAAPDVTYPRVVERHGDLPEPYPDFGALFGAHFGGADEAEDEAGDDDEALLEDEPLDDAASALGDEAAVAAREYDAHFAREDAADAPRARELVVRDVALARRIAERFGTRPAQFDMMVDEHPDEAIPEWLEMLPFDAEDHGLRDEAIALCEALAPLLDPADLAASRATLLQRAGRNDEARAQAERAVDAYLDNIDVRVRAAETLRAAGDLARAEDLCRSVLAADLEGEDVLHYGGAIDTLAEVMRATGRADEAAALAQSAQAERAREFEDGGDGDPMDTLAALFQGGLEDAPAERTAVRAAAPKSRRGEH